MPCPRQAIYCTVPQLLVRAKENVSAPERGYLAALGDKLRETRAKRGLSRRVLAADSGVSERYLAQLEAGQGNVSILLLRQIAAALTLSLTELLAEERVRAAAICLR